MANVSTTSGSSSAPPDDDGRDLVEAAAVREDLSGSEQDRLLAYFLQDGERPGESKTQPLEVELGKGIAPFKCSVRAIEWEAFEDSRERGRRKDGPQEGTLDQFIASSYIVARALVEPRLGPVLSKVQKKRGGGENVPQDGAALLREWFAKKPGALISLNDKVLDLSKLGIAGAEVREVEAAGN